MLRVVRIILATLSMYIVTHLFVFVTLPLAILVSYINRDKIPATKQAFVRCLFAIVGKELKVSGLENLERDRGYLIVSNYPSFYAGFALMGAFPRASVVAHAFMKRIPLLAQVLRRVGAIFVQPGRAGQGARAIDESMIGSGVAHGVIILPEGARTPDGGIHRFRYGFVRILRQTSLDLLPVTLNGLYQLKPMRRFYLDPDAQPEMVIHPPVRNESVRGMRDDEVLTMAQSIVASVYRP